MPRRVMVAAGIAFLAVVASLALVAQGCTDNDATCPPFPATNYDRSCKVDSDCVAVVEQGFCCPGEAIRVDAQSQYMSDFNKANAACAPQGCTVSCPGTGEPCCREGTCQLGPAMCATADDAGAAGSLDAGAE
jgi:hypothetical protein